MKKLDIKYLWILFIVLMFSCIDDDSKFGGVDIDEIKIEGIKDYQEIEWGGHLIVQPNVTTKFGDKSNLSFVWYKYNQEQSIADTLAYTKDLDVVINDVLPGVETTLTFKVIDNNTGVYSLYNSKFVTLGKYSGGTLMLYRNNGEIELGLLKKDGTTLYENIFSQMNEGEKLGSASKRIILTKNYPQNSLPYKAVVVTCDDPTGGVYLDADAFIKKDIMKNKFVFGEDMTGNIVISGNYNNQSTEYLIVNGKVHGRAFGYSDRADWDPEIVFLSNPIEYAAAAFVAQPTDYPFYAAPVFYDNLNGRFMLNTNGGYFSSISGENDDISKFDPSNVGKGIILVASGSMNSSLNEIWALMKNTNSGEYMLLTYKFIYDFENRTYSFVSLSKQVIPTDKCPGLYAATTFVPGTKQLISSSYPWVMEAKGISDVLLYLSNNKVYALNVHNVAEGVIVDGNQENYTLTTLDCTEVSWPTADDPNATIPQLTLGIIDQSAGDKKAGIATYKLDNIGGLSAHKLYAKTGFCDEVLFTIEKQE